MKRGLCKLGQLSIPFAGTIFIFFYSLSSRETLSSGSTGSPVCTARVGRVSSLECWASGSFCIGKIRGNSSERGKRGSGSSQEEALGALGLSWSTQWSQGTTESLSPFLAIFKRQHVDLLRERTTAFQGTQSSSSQRSPGLCDRKAQSQGWASGAQTLQTVSATHC